MYTTIATVVLGVTRVIVVSHVVNLSLRCNGTTTTEAVKHRVVVKLCKASGHAACVVCCVCKHPTL